LLLLLALMFAFSVNIKSQTETTDKQFWPAAKLNFDLPRKFRLQFVAERDEEGATRIQSKYSAFLNFRMKEILKSHLKHVDSDESYYLAVGVGYEHIYPSGENRLVIQGIPRYQPGLGILLTDRSRFEFRWLTPGYDFRYRNQLIVKRGFKVGRVDVWPYGSGEVYWDRKYHAFNENTYAVGAELPYKHWFMLDTYFKRQNCNTCSKEKVNILGVSVSLFFGGKKK